MYSYTSSSKRRTLALVTAVTFSILAGYNWLIASYADHANGGFVWLIDQDLIRNKARELFESGDLGLVVLGSSRAKEAVRPSVISQELAGRFKVANLACHSCSSVDLVHSYTQPDADSGRLPRVPPVVIVTVEPLHFTPRNVRLDLNRPAAPEDRGSWAAWLRRANRSAQAAVNAWVGEVLYTVLPASHPAERRALDGWLRLPVVIAREVRAGRPLPDAIREQFTFLILTHGSRFYTVVTEWDGGYEGHALHLAAPDATRAEAFASHQSIYQNSVLPQYSRNYFQIFEQDLKTLAATGSRLILVRLPVYKNLYEIEQKFAADFDQTMAGIGQRLGIPYLTLQDHFPDLAGDLQAFTDGSHMDVAATRRFTEGLAQLLRPYLPSGP